MCSPWFAFLVSLSLSLEDRERKAARKNSFVLLQWGGKKKTKKLLAESDQSYNTFSTPSFSHTFRHAARPPRLERAGQRAQRQGH